MYCAYASETAYEAEYDTIPNVELKKRLKKASRHIDSLTFNRIVGRGFDNLTPFQQGIVIECVCELADFEFENEDMINSVLQSYAINGVSMQFGSSWNVRVQNGVAIQRDTYEKLCQTGLCTAVIR